MEKAKLHLPMDFIDRNVVCMICSSRGAILSNPSKWFVCWRLCKSMWLFGTRVGNMYCKLRFQYVANVLNGRHILERKHFSKIKIQKARISLIGKSQTESYKNITNFNKKSLRRQKRTCKTWIKLIKYATNNAQTTLKLCYLNNVYVISRINYTFRKMYWRIKKWTQINVNLKILFICFL